MFPDWLVVLIFFLGIGIGWVSRMLFDFEAREDDYRRGDRPPQYEPAPAPVPRSPMHLEDDRKYDVQRRFEAGDPSIEAVETVGECTDWSPPPGPDWIFYNGIEGSSGPEGVVGYRATWLREITHAGR